MLVVAIIIRIHELTIKNNRMLASTEQDALIRIRVDMLSNRPHAMRNYSLQGTKDCCEYADQDLVSRYV